MTTTIPICRSCSHVEHLVGISCPNCGRASRSTFQCFEPGSSTAIIPYGVHAPRFVKADRNRLAKRLLVDVLMDHPAQTWISPVAAVRLSQGALSCSDVAIAIFDMVGDFPKALGLQWLKLSEDVIEPKAGVADALTQNFLFALLSEDQRGLVSRIKDYC